MSEHITPGKLDALSAEELLVYFYDKHADIYNRLNKPVDKHQLLEKLKAPHLSATSTSSQTKSKTSDSSTNKRRSWVREHIKWIFSGIGVPVVGAIFALVVSTCSTPQAIDDEPSTTGDTIIQNDANQPINIQGGVGGNVIINSGQSQSANTPIPTSELPQAATIPSAAVTTISDPQPTSTATANSQQFQI